MTRIDGFYERHLDDWKSLLAARLLLFSVYDFISYAVGLGHIRLSVYIAVSFFGGLLPTYVFVAIGSEAAQNQDVLLFFYIAAAALFVVWLVFRRQLNSHVGKVIRSKMNPYKISVATSYFTPPKNCIYPYAIISCSHTSDTA